MRLPAPRVIAIDDEPKHLEGLAQGLNQYGAACLPVHFTGETAISPCSQVRVIFADLHLSGGLSRDHVQDFSMIGGLIEDTIQPSGPYFIILWTMYPDQASALYEFLVKRLQNVAKPFTVQALDKNDHLDPQGNIRDPEELVEAIGRIVAEQPQIGALLNWEERVLGATADTVSSITKMAVSAAVNVSPAEEIDRLLKNFAIAAVGKDHVEEDRFQAVNETLLPILADRIASMRSREIDRELWKAAFGESETSSKLRYYEAAKLNRLLHIAHPTDISSWMERGSVIPLPKRASGDKFKRWFGLEQEMAASKSFGCQDFDSNDARFRWILVQSQAACDYAQIRPGPLTFYLGLCCPKPNDHRRSRRSRPAALWTSPCFYFDGGPFLLHVNAGFQMPLPRTARGIEKPIFRLREQLLNDMIYRLHGHSARPGIVSFRS